MSIYNIKIERCIYETAKSMEIPHLKVIEAINKTDIKRSNFAVGVSSGKYAVEDNYLVYSGTKLPVTDENVVLDLSRIISPVGLIFSDEIKRIKFKAVKLNKNSIFKIFGIKWPAKLISLTFENYYIDFSLFDVSEIKFLYQLNFYNCYLNGIPNPESKWYKYSIWNSTISFTYIDGTETEEIEEFVHEFHSYYPNLEYMYSELF